MSELATAAQHFGILDHTPMGMTVIRSDFVVLFWNSCLENWTGIARQEITSRDIGIHFPHLKSPQYRSRLETIFNGGPPAIFSSQLHSHIIPSPLPSGQLRIQHTIATAVPALDGHGFYALFAVQDVTELTHRIHEYRRMRDQALEEIKQRELAEEELRQANTMILEQQRALIEEERLKVLLQMAGTTAHELNQPLMGLLGNIELMKMVKHDPERQSKRVDAIEECGQRIAEIVKRIQSIRHYATKPYLGKDSIISLEQEVRVLAVTDGEGQFETIYSSLRDQSQFDTMLAGDMREAFEKLEEGRFDVIVLAYDLPDGNGLDFLKRLQNTAIETPVLVIARHTDEIVTSRVVAVGACDCLHVSKVSRKTLPHLIISTLEKAHIRTELKEAQRRIGGASDK
jgi:two-component system, cell cycle response regulator